MKLKILIPVFNDWQSVFKLLEDINFNVSSLDHEISVIIINDASNYDRKKEDKNLDNISSVKILNMKTNQGHARCIATGLKYVFQKEDFDYVIPMDGDGEDRPEEIREFINRIQNSNGKPIVGERIKRSENLIFKICYQLHKLITFTFTGKSIKFGNFTCLPKSTVEKLINEKATWNSFSGSLTKVEDNLISIPSIRGSRYFGPSKMSLYKLIIHSFSIIAVFKYQVFFRSLLVIIFLGYTSNHYPFISHLIQVQICIFNLIIFIISLRENEKELLKSCANLKDRNIITH